MCGSGYNIFRFKYVEITNNWEHAQILILKNENGDEPWGSGGWETKVPKTREPKKEGKIRNLTARWLPVWFRTCV